MIIKAKIQPFIAIMSSALIIGLVVGMPFGMITDTLAEGVGTTLQTIAILIGLGSMFGAILQVSGGVEVIADTLLRVFGEKKHHGHLELRDSLSECLYFRVRSADTYSCCFWNSKKDKEVRVLLFNSAFSRTCNRTCFCAANTGTSARGGDA